MMWKQFLAFAKDKWKLFTTAFLQVTFVAMNVNFIAKGQIVAMLMTGFMISFIWTFNVKKAAFGTMWDRIVYSAGATVGTGIGFWVSHLITKG